MQNKRIILVGKAASGKDYLRRKFQKRGFKYGISYTTRPPREGEVDGVDYFFLSEKIASEMIANEEFYEYVYFNGWLYGTTKKQFHSDNLFIMTPKGVSHIKPEDRQDSFIIYCDIEMSIRNTRLHNRQMPGDTVERRIVADEIDFSEFNDYDLRITNPDF